jgi:hypothetical protein
VQDYRLASACLSVSALNRSRRSHLAHGRAHYYLIYIYCYFLDRDLNEAARAADAPREAHGAMVTCRLR